MKGPDVHSHGADSNLRADEVDDPTLQAAPHAADDTVVLDQPVVLDQAVVLDDPFDDDLDIRLAAVAPRPMASRTTYALAAMLLLVAGFVFGAQVQKHFGTPVSTAVNGGAAAAAAPSGNARGRGGNGAQPGGAATATSAITGTVKLVDGTTVYIDTSDGQVITVKTTATTAVARPGTLKDLSVGATVTIEGQNTNGTVDATRITMAR
jgi:hypothetical protein